MKSLFYGAFALTAACGLLTAGPVLDGVVSASDGYSYVGTLNPYVNGADASGGVQSVALYWTLDDNFVYGAVVGDTSLPHQGFANIYVYSSGPSTDANGAHGVYGDGNDVLIEGTTRFGFGDPSGYIPGTTQNFTSTVNNHVTNASAGGVSVAFNDLTLVEEFQIDKSLLGNYDVLRFGGQLFAYEFNTGSGDRVPGILVAESPEPATWLTLAGALSALPLIRRRNRKA